MVDVDETYREPLLGEALYHEKALTITRVRTHTCFISDLWNCSSFRAFKSVDITHI